MLASHTSVGSLEISQRIKAIVILAVNEGRIIQSNPAISKPQGKWKKVRNSGASK